MFTIACVLKTGKWNAKGKKPDVYEPWIVKWLYKQIEKNVTIPYRFVCLTNEPNSFIDTPKIETIKLKNNWEGWWSKIEMFDPVNELNDCFYLDLDTVILKNINHLLTEENNDIFTVLKNMSGNKKAIGSGFMRWKGDYSFLYNEFSENLISNYQTSNRWGDQGYIQDKFIEKNIKLNYWQDKFPNSLLSYNFNFKPKGKLDGSEDVIIFHGKPRPWEVANEYNWIPKK